MMTRKILLFTEHLSALWSHVCPSLLGYVSPVCSFPFSTLPCALEPNWWTDWHIRSNVIFLRCSNCLLLWFAQCSVYLSLILSLHSLWNCNTPLIMVIPNEKQEGILPRDPSAPPTRCLSCTPSSWSLPCPAPSDLDADQAQSEDTSLLRF